MKSSAVVWMLFTVLVLIVLGKAQGKPSDIKNHLNGFEKVKITELKRSYGNKFERFEKGEMSIELTAYKNKFILDLTIYFQRSDVAVIYISESMNNTSSFLDLKLQIYQGKVRNVKGSFVLGSFTKSNLFRGYIVTDVVYCVEPVEEEHMVMVYRFGDVLFPDCGKEGDCSETKYYTSWEANKVLKSLKYLPYSWFYDTYLKLISEIHDNALKFQELKKDNPVSTENINNTKGEGGKVGGDENEKKTGSAKQDSHYISKRITATDIDNSDKQDNDDDDNNKHDKDDDDNNKHNNDHHDDDRYVHYDGNNEINGAKRLSEIKNAIFPDVFRKKKDAYSINGILDTELENYRLWNRKVEKAIHRTEDAPDNNGEIDSIKSPSFNKSSDIPDLIGTNLTKSMDPFVRNSSLFEFADTTNGTNGMLSDEPQKKEKRRVKMPPWRKLSEKPAEYVCYVQFELSTTIRKRFNGDYDDVIKDIIVQTTLLDKIFHKVSLQRKGKPFHFHIEVSEIVMYDDKFKTPFQSGGDLEYFNKGRRQLETCLSIGLMYEKLKSGQMVDGYIPKGKGGVCAKSGNVLIMSYGSPKEPLPMALYFSALMRGITRSIGANDEDKACTEGAITNPMELLQDYILSKEIIPEKHYEIFTECNVKEIETAVNNIECFVETMEPWCGNAIVDEGEECDCGPDFICDQIDPCCTSHHVMETKKAAHRGCKLIKKATCSMDKPCCEACSIIMAKERVCADSPDPCGRAKCDGKSAECPTDSKISNGMVCKHAKHEPLICKDRKCGPDHLCSANGDKACTCEAETGKECVYCCEKDGKCKAAGTGLGLAKGIDSWLPDGTQCSKGKCLKGKCVENTKKRDTHALSPPRFPVSVAGVDLIEPYSVCCYLLFLLMTVHLSGRYFILL